MTHALWSITCALAPAILVGLVIAALLRWRHGVVPGGLAAAVREPACTCESVTKHRVGAHLLIQGAQFSPARAEAELGVDFGPTKNEPGELGIKGKFAGRATPYGSALWEFEWETGELLPDPFLPFTVPDLKGRLTALGAEEITLYIHVAYSGQCNLEMSSPLLGALAGLGITVSISCYEA